MDAHPKPRPISEAPCDGTMLRLWVRYPEGGSWTPLDDARESWTIGFNNRDNTDDDRWQVVGWCWSHDHLVEASSDVEILGWLPFHGDAPHDGRTAAKDEGAAGADTVSHHAKTDVDPVVSMLRDVAERLDRSDPDLLGARVGVLAVRLAVSSRLLAHPSPPPAADADADADADRVRECADLFKALRDQSWDLRCFDVPTGGDDCDIGWRVVGHWQAEPKERVVAEVFVDDPAAAVRQALAALRSTDDGQAEP